MGFYSPQSLVADARRHGITARGPDINASAAKAMLEPVNPATIGAGAASPAPAPIPPAGAEPELSHAVRLGLAAVRTIGDDLAKAIVAERETNGPYRDMTDLTARITLTTPQVEALATAGAFEAFQLDRRQALWSAGAAAQSGPDRLAGVVAGGTHAPPLPGMSVVEIAVADVWATGVSPDSHPIQFLRERLDELGAVPIGRLDQVPDRTRILVAGAVTHRQRPATAGGVTFMNLEDETGMLNIVASRGLFSRSRRIIQGNAALIVRGRLEKADGVINLVAEKVMPLRLSVRSSSRDWR